MRIIGTIFGAAIGYEITKHVHNQSLLLFFLFLLASVYFVVRNTNYALTTLFLTPFILRTPEYFKSRADVTCPSTTIGYANRCRTSLMRSFTPLDWLSLEEISVSRKHFQQVKVSIASVTYPYFFV